ncbi:hypothetical protein VNO78_28915 [Psophocarpus tetragonolobus]|uniref:Uncharacterized protein n=1 Tax=Psophocarpus tetragonolobus TaxID=3891 RepID=A0AAN9RU27_PSOTE
MRKENVESHSKLYSLFTKSFNKTREEEEEKLVCGGSKSQQKEKEVVGEGMTCLGREQDVGTTQTTLQGVVKRKYRRIAGMMMLIEARSSHKGQALNRAQSGVRDVALSI